MTLRLFLTSVLSFGVFAASHSALALSCMAPDLGKAMETAKESDLTYYIFVGEFVTPDYPKQEVDITQDYFKPKSPILARSWFEGVSLSSQSLTDVPLVSFPVDLEVGCAGPWCGAPPVQGQTHITFVEARSGASPILRISPCRSKVFSVRDDDGQIEKLRQCFDKTCSSDFELQLNE